MVLEGRWASIVLEGCLVEARLVPEDGMIIGVKFLDVIAIRA